MTKNILTNFWMWLGLVALLLVLIVARVPASFAAYAFTQAIPGLSLAEVQGSLWAGSAGSALLSVERDVYSLGRFQWRLKPLSLLTFKPCANISFAFQSQSAKGDVCAAGEQVQLANFNVNVPAELLDLWFATTLAGDLSLVVNKGTINGLRVEALDGNLSWRNGALLNGDSWIALGTFGANLTADNQGGVNAELVDLGGPVIADLDINYNRILRPNDPIGVIIKGEIGVRDSAHPELQKFLPTMASAIGEETERGYAIEWQQ
ncbi:type II secretion system protein N [Halioxenophilus sp. WMMB6]|uniref:type II secretion system protein N n=1 Tax=Halioxenophilus sp. WMMB6 TaxID=3073815 RepID=UPI00295EAA8B|nr:type II secretion system protein N [Halioxenophilus sp. WMMB6]